MERTLIARQTVTQNTFNSVNTPNWTVERFPNKEIWITRDLKTLLNKKKEAFQLCDWGGAEEDTTEAEGRAEGGRQKEAGGKAPAERRKGMYGPGWRQWLGSR